MYNIHQPFGGSHPSSQLPPLLSRVCPAIYDYLALGQLTSITRKSESSSTIYSLQEFGITESHYADYVLGTDMYWLPHSRRQPRICCSSFYAKSGSLLLVPVVLPLGRKSPIYPSSRGSHFPYSRTALSSSSAAPNTD